MARTGVLGGSFNPVHYGHLLLADEVLESLGLDYPVVSAAKKAELAEARKLLDSEKKTKR